MLPGFRSDGYLPDGLHGASIDELRTRFGGPSARRRRLMSRIAYWHHLAVAVGAERMLIDGSFVTAKCDPGDADVVIWLPADIEDQLERNREDAITLDGIISVWNEVDLFGVVDAAGWNDWVAFFGRTREADGRGKGLVEVEL